MRAARLVQPTGADLRTLVGAQGTYARRDRLMREGRCFHGILSAGAGVSAACKFTWQNPSGSTKNYELLEFTVRCSLTVPNSSAVFHWELRLNPTTGLPTTTVSPTAARVGGAETSSAVLKQGFDQTVPTPVELGGGSLAGRIGCVERKAVSFDEPATSIVLQPGVTAGFGVLMISANSGVSAELNLLWAELDP